MKIRMIGRTAALAVLGCGWALSSLTGCQSTVGGQTLPSASYLRDDVQYHPAGPEDQLSRLKSELENYRLAQEGLDLEAP